jgi:hypothetical protein
MSEPGCRFAGQLLDNTFYRLTDPSVQFRHTLLNSDMVAEGTSDPEVEKAAENFKHVANALLRGVLQPGLRHVRPSDMRQPLFWTLDALGRDVIDDALPLTGPCCIDPAVGFP